MNNGSGDSWFSISWGTATDIWSFGVTVSLPLTIRLVTEKLILSLLQSLSILFEVSTSIYSNLNSHWTIRCTRRISLCTSIHGLGHSRYLTRRSPMRRHKKRLFVSCLRSHQRRWNHSPVSAKRIFVTRIRPLYSRSWSSTREIALLRRSSCRMNGSRSFQRGPWDGIRRRNNKRWCNSVKKMSKAQPPLI